MVAAPPKACASCRYRKIKCDRRDKLKEAEASDDSDVKCTNCQATGTNCTFISAPPKQRQGKRIRALREHEQDELLYGTGNNNNSTASSSSSSQVIIPRQSNGINQSSFNQQRIPQSIPGSSSGSTIYGGGNSSLPLEIWRPAEAGLLNQSNRILSSNNTTSDQPPLRPGMFGISGLTRPLLEACIAAYLFSVSPTLPIIRPDSFIPRLRAFFKLYSGEPESSEQIEPLDDLLVIAVACAGSSCLSTNPTSSLPGSNRKFAIQKDLKNLFNSFVEQENGERLRKSGLDGIEACYIMAVIQEDERSSVRTFGMQDNNHHAPGLRISPASTEGVVRLANSLGLNRRSQESQETMSQAFARANGDGQYLEETGSRRNRQWWCILGNDAFRSMAYRRPSFIPEDSFDHGGDGKLPNSAALKGLPNHVIFEFNWLTSMVTLTFLARSITPKILSERAQRRGIACQDALWVVDALEKWRDQSPISWEGQHANGLHGTGEGSEERAFKCRLRALFVECLYHSSVVALYYGLEDAGFRRLNQDAVETPSYLPKTTLNPIPTHSVRSSMDGNQGSSSIQSNPLNPSNPSPVNNFNQDSSATSNLTLFNTLEIVERFATKTFNRLAFILPQAASEGMIRASASILRGSGTAAILWGCEKATREARGGLESTEVDQILTQVQHLIDAIATCDSSEQTPEIVKQMEGALARARTTAREILSTRRSSTSGSSTFASPPTFNQDQTKSSSTNSAPFFSYPSSSTPNFGQSQAQTPNFDFASPSNSIQNPSTANVNSNNLSSNQAIPNFGMETDSDDLVPEWLSSFVAASGNQDVAFPFSFTDPQWSANNQSSGGGNPHGEAFMNS